MFFRKGRFIFLCVVAVVIISVVALISKYSLEESSPPTPVFLEKIGKIYFFDPWFSSQGPLTFIEFEDGEFLIFVGTIPNVQIGKTYRIIYRELTENLFPEQQGGTYYIAESIEDVST